MGRRRDLESSEFFHVIQKGADGQDIFSAVSHRTVYEELMADAFDRSSIEVHAYAWMTNHVHKLVHAPNGGLPEAMHRLGTRYASLYNGWTDRSGPLFTARYFSEPVTSDAQLQQSTRYIHRNPLPIVGSAGLVGYRWSSLGAHCGHRPAPEWLVSGLVMEGFDASSYARFVLTPQPSDREWFGELPPPTATGCDEIEAAVAAAVGRPVGVLRKANGTVSDDARTLMITLAVEFRSGTSAQLADRYGLLEMRSIRRIARRGRAKATQSTSFAALRRRVLTELDRSTFPADPADPGWGIRGGTEVA